MADEEHRDRFSSRPRPRGWRARLGVVLGALLIALLGSLPALGNTEIEQVTGEEEEELFEDDLLSTCQRIADKLASVGLEECLEVGLELSGSRAVSGTPILIKEYPPVAGRLPLGRVLLIGGIHGDEYSSVTIVFKWLGLLNAFHSGLFHWRISPLMNPDGLLRSKSQRMNANGVDLNRNFPCPDWHKATQEYWVDRTSRNPRRYPGPDPLSEPESQWLATEIERFEPEVIVSVHAPHSLVDFDGPPEAPEKLGSLELRLLGTYPGSLGRYAGVHRNIPVVTIELPSAGSMPSAAEQWRIWRDLVRWLKDRLPVTAEPVAEEAP